jgi:Fe-S cluster assembly scaffold protein SufB
MHLHGEYNKMNEPKQLGAIEKNILEQISDLHDIPAGAYNLRENGRLEGRRSSANIDIVTKTDNPGIDIIVKPGTKNESVHIPVILTESGLSDLVYNDFFIGEGADVLIIAGCGIHNDGSDKTQHDGIHTFHIADGAKVRYVEKHYGAGNGTGDKILNPQTIVKLGRNSVIEMETVQLKGVDSTKRFTKVVAGAGSNVVITEKLLTHGAQSASSEMDVILDGEGSSARIISRSIAQDNSEQKFYPRLSGNAACFGHVQCDAIIMGDARVRAIPEIAANNIDAQLIHEAAIGRIAGDQIIKLLTLGLDEKQAEERILAGFLK